MTKEPINKHHIFAVNIDGDGVADESPKDEDGNNACLSDTWINAVDIEDVKSAVEWQIIKDEKIFNDFQNGKINFLTLVQRIGNTRLKAFEDVTKCVE